MSLVRSLALAAGGVTAAALLAAAPATADPGMPPCGGLLAQVCDMIPTMPELDHDIDLTKQQPPGTGVDQESLPPPDVCAIACI
jgi:hypothetical protein